MEKVFVIYIVSNEKKYLYDVGHDEKELKKTALLMTATDPVFKYRLASLSYQRYLQMIRESKADQVTVCSLIENYLNEELTV